MTESDIIEYKAGLFFNTSMWYWLIKMRDTGSMSLYMARGWSLSRRCHRFLFTGGLNENI